MASGLEFEGKNVESAVKNACSQLNVKEENLKYDVISYGSTGIFGLVGVKKARIRVTSPKKKFNRKEQRGSKAESRKEENVLREEDRAEIRSIVEESFGEEEAKEEDWQEIDRSLEKNETKSDEDAVEVGKKILKKIVDLITDEADITAEKREKRLNLCVTGGNPAVLIGKKGQTLEAIQYIVEKVVNKKCGERVRIQVDVEGYLKNRKLNLERLSSRLAEKAKRIGKPVTIGHMNAYDRRIVHLFLKDDGEIRTQSIGDGYYRKLVIFPKKGKKNKNRKKK